MVALINMTGKGSYLGYTGWLQIFQISALNFRLKSLFPTLELLIQSIEWLLEIWFEFNWMDQNKFENKRNHPIAEIRDTTSSWTKSAPFRGNFSIWTDTRWFHEIYENVAHSIFQQIQWKNDDLWRYEFAKSILQKFTSHFFTQRWAVLSKKELNLYWSP